MALMNWEQNVGKSNLSAKDGEILLRNFRYPSEIDSKGNLLIDIGNSKLVIGFKNNGLNSTWVGVKRFKNKIWTLIITIILLCIFVIPGFIYMLFLNNNRKKIFIEAINVINQNLNKLNENNTI